MDTDRDEIKEEIKTEVLPRLLKIVVGVFLLFLVPEEAPMPVRIGAVLILLYAGVQAILLIQSLPIVIAYIIPSKPLPKDRIDKRALKLHTWVAWFFTGLLGGSLLLLLSEIRHIEDTIRGMYLFWIAAGLGVLTALLLLVVLRWVFPGIYSYSISNKGTIILGALLSFFMLFPSIASIINGYNTTDVLDNNLYVVADKGENTRRGRTTYWVFISVKGRDERLEVDEELYYTTEIGDSCYLVTEKGYLGYDIVFDIIKKR